MSKIPEGATHWGPETDVSEEVWYMVADNGDVYALLADEYNPDLAPDWELTFNSISYIEQQYTPLIELTRYGRPVNPWVEYANRCVSDAQKHLIEVVKEQFPVGMLVDRQHGEHWIGPCEVIGYSQCSWSTPGAFHVRNLKTGKVTEVSDYSVRPSEMNHD